MMLLPNHFLEKMDPAERRKLGKAGMTASEAAAKQIARSERDLQNLIANELLRRGIWFTRSAMNRPTTNTVGTPDFVFCVKGRFCAVEVKFAKGRVRPEQATAIADIALNGGAAKVVRSFQEFIEFLNGGHHAA
jgi:hypothetical protein